VCAKAPLESAAQLGDSRPDQWHPNRRHFTR
jgi:hypothetical protein